MVGIKEKYIVSWIKNVYKNSIISIWKDLRLCKNRKFESSTNINR